MVSSVERDLTSSRALPFLFFGAKTCLKDINNIFKKVNRKTGCKDKDRNIGVNGVVRKAHDMIKGAKKYYYIALLPEKINSDDLQNKFIKLNEKLNLKMETKNIRCAYWDDIRAFFADKKEATSIHENFKFNEVEIDGKIQSQIY